MRFFFVATALAGILAVGILLLPERPVAPGRGLLSPAASPCPPQIVTRQEVEAAGGVWGAAEVPEAIKPKLRARCAELRERNR